MANELAHKTIRMRGLHGEWDIDINLDPNYPGVDIEYIPDNCERNKTFPRVIIEEQSENVDSFRVLLWSNSESEDYEEEISFR